MQIEETVIKDRLRVSKECVYPNGHSFFYRDIQNFTAVAKLPFVFLQENSKFYSCTLTAIHFLKWTTEF